MITSATASATRSDSAVASTYVASRALRELIMNVRTSSPARAGRKLLPKYPAAVAQNAVDTLTVPSALSRMRHRHARRKSVTVPMPAVRMMRVCPIAMMPTTATCWMTSDRLSAVRKRSVLVVKKIEARMSASRGPRVDIARARAKTRFARSGSVRLIGAITAWSTESIVAGSQARASGSPR